MPWPTSWDGRWWRKRDREENIYYKAIELEPENADALNNLGVLLAQRGDLATAMDLFRRAVEPDPHPLNAMENLEHAIRLFKP